jgi:hypothetical protein
MDITINGSPIDIILDDEKTVGDLVAGLCDWLLGSGLFVGSVEVDGKTTPASGVAELLSVNLSDARSVNINTVAAAELCVEALTVSAVIIARCEAAPAEKDALVAKWREGPSVSFLKTYEPEVYELIEKILAGEYPGTIESVLAERERELSAPVKEFLDAENAVAALVGRLGDLALDTQTGKEARAAETVRMFSILTSKLFRLIPLLRSSGIEFEKLSLDEKFFEEFDSALKEFLAAYENSDTVLSGDLAEYEIAPRLNDLYAAVKNKTEQSYTGSAVTG